MTRFPQILVNVRGRRQGRRRRGAGVLARGGGGRGRLGDSGRVLLRPSGTESLVRVMVEADTIEQAQAVAERVAAVVATV